MERIPYPYTDDHAVYFIDMANREEEEGHGIFRGIEVDGRLAGIISAEGKQDVYSRDAEVGYYLDSEYQGRGIMAEAFKELSSICFFLYSPKGHLSSLRKTLSKGKWPSGHISFAL